MTKQVADDLLGNARSQQLNCAGMPEDMRAAFPRRLDACSVKSSAQVAIDTLKRAIGRTGAEEDFPVIGLRSTATEIVEQCFARGRHQRQDRASARFGVVDAQRIGAPVDILEPQMRDLAHAQAIGREKLEDCIVAQPDRRAVLPSHIQYDVDLVATQRRGDRLIGVEHGRDDVGGEVTGTSAFPCRYRNNDRSRSTTSFNDLRLRPGERRSM